MLFFICTQDAHASNLCNSKKNILYEGIEGNNYKLIEKILSNSNTLYVKDCFRLKNQDGDGIVLFSVKKYRYKLIDILLSNKLIILDLINDKKENIINIATYQRDQKLLKIIFNKLDSPALSNLVNNQDIKGNTPLIVATQNGDLDIMMLLLTHDAQFTIENDNGEHALKIAIDSRNKKAIDMLMPTLDYLPTEKRLQVINYIKIKDKRLYDDLLSMIKKINNKKNFWLIHVSDFPTEDDSAQYQKKLIITNPSIKENIIVKYNKLGIQQLFIGVFSSYNDAKIYKQSLKLFDSKIITIGTNVKKFIDDYKIIHNTKYMICNLEGTSINGENGASPIKIPKVPLASNNSSKVTRSQNLIDTPLVTKNNNIPTNKATTIDTIGHKESTDKANHSPAIGHKESTDKANHSPAIVHREAKDVRNILSVTKGNNSKLPADKHKNNNNHKIKQNTSGLSSNNNHNKNNKNMKDKNATNKNNKNMKDKNAKGKNLPKVSPEDEEWSLLLSSNYDINYRGRQKMYNRYSDGE